MPLASEQTIRAAFFDFTTTATAPEEISRCARYIDDGLLKIDAGRIVSLQPFTPGDVEADATRVIDLRGKLIMPGFIDTHIHYPQMEVTAASGDQLLEWLNHYIYPAEGKYHCAQHAARMSAFFLEQLLSNGTTTALVFGTVHPQSVEALFSAAGALNMRLIAGKVMMDRHAPDYLLEDAETSFQQTRELIERWHNRGRLSYALTPRFAPATSPALLEKVQALRHAWPDIWLQTHLSENIEEVAWVKSLFPERENYLDVYHHYQLTGRRSVFAHCLHLEEKEWDCLRATGSSIAFCPTSNLFLGSGVFNLQRCWQQRVKMGIGTDIGAGTTFNLLQTLNEAWKVGQLGNYRLSACEAFYHATLGGAHALDLDSLIGNFSAGKEADFVVIDPAVTPLQQLRIDNSQDIYEQLFILMMSGNDRNIMQTWVNGQPVWQRDQKRRGEVPSR